MSIKSSQDTRPLRLARRPWDARPKIDVHQYAVGIMRVGQDSSVGDTYITNNNSTTEIHSYEVKIVYEDPGHTPGKITEGTETAWIYLPENGCLVWDGVPMKVSPLQGANQNGDWYELPQPSDIWCAIIRNQYGVYAAQLYEKDDIPKNAVFKYHVVSVPPTRSGRAEAREDGTPVSYGVSQYAFGLVTAGTSGDVLPGPFDPVYNEKGILTGFGDGYIQVGGLTLSVSPNTDIAPTEGFVCVEMNCASDSTPFLTSYTDSELTTEQQDLDKLVIPIFKMTGLEDEETGATIPSIAMDLRRMPMTGMLETFLKDDET